jgi:hypothetical protein
MQFIHVGEYKQEDEGVSDMRSRSNQTMQEVMKGNEVGI